MFMDKVKSFYGRRKRPAKERRLTGHVITNFQLFLAVVLFLSKAALAGHKIGQNE